MHSMVFNNSYFCTLVTFSNRNFSHGAFFEGCTFAMAPNFYSAKLHQNTTFENSSFEDTSGNRAARAYRTLKLAMEEHRARNEEAVFYSLEQQSLRNSSETPIFVKLLSTAYDWFSEYGQSPARALAWLSVFTALFFTAFIFIHGGWTDFDTLFAFSIEQIVRPFFIWTSAGGEAACNLFGSSKLFGIRLTATLHSILCLTTLTLFFLAIRWRFRRG
ncbi:MAG: hypothetical protein ACKVKG_00575 [Alphaproteobacteria bacterium]